MALSPVVDTETIKAIQRHFPIFPPLALPPCFSFPDDQQRKPPAPGAWHTTTRAWAPSPPVLLEPSTAVAGFSPPLEASLWLLACSGAFSLKAPRKPPSPSSCHPLGAFSAFHFYLTFDPTAPLEELS